MRYWPYRIGRSNSLYKQRPVILSRVWIGGGFMAELFSSVVAVDAEALMARLEAIDEKIGRLLEAKRIEMLADGVDPRNMSTAEAAAFLKVSKAFLNKSRMPKSKTVGPPYHVNGSRVYYTLEDLEAWRDSTKRECVQSLTPMERRLRAVSKGGGAL